MPKYKGITEVQVSKKEEKYLPNKGTYTQNKAIRISTANRDGFRDIRFNLSLSKGRQDRSLRIPSRDNRQCSTH